MLNRYRVFIEYCVFFQEFSKVCHLSLASTRLLLVVQKITSQQEWLYTRIALRALQIPYKRCKRGRGCSELWNNTIFPEHPVAGWTSEAPRRTCLTPQGGEALLESCSRLCQLLDLRSVFWFSQRYFVKHIHTGCPKILALSAIFVVYEWIGQGLWVTLWVMYVLPIHLCIWRIFSDE